MYPVIFQIGSFSISSYGVMNALGYLAAVWYFISVRKKIGISKEDIWDIMFVAILAAILGGKLMHILVELKPMLAGTFKENIAYIIHNFRYGYVFFGGFIAVVISLVILFRKKKLPLLQTSDFIIVGLPLGHAIGRIGCFLVGCCNGKPWDGPWAVTFTNPKSLVPPELLGVPLHPTQLYEVLFNAALFFVLLRFYNKPHKNGSILALYFAFYGAGRFFMEFFRGDYRGGFFLGMSPSQTVGLGIVLCSIIFYFVIRKKNYE